MSMNKKEKRNTLIGVGVVLALTAGAGTYYISSHSPDKKNPTLEEQIEEAVATKLFAFTDNGEVTLYDSKNGKELDKFDLKTLSTGKEAVVETPVEEPAKVEIVKEQPKAVTEEYGGFLRVPHLVVAGENSWKIQETLTPKRDTATMLNLVVKANGKKKLHPIYPGETLYYLKEKDGSSPEAFVKEIETGKPLPKAQTVVKKVDDDAVYLYSKSEDFKTLYAFNDIEQAFYSLSSNGKKIEATVFFTGHDLKGVQDFKVVDGKLYIVFDYGKKVREIDLSNEKYTKEYVLKGAPDIFAVRNGFFFYTYADKLGKLDLSNGDDRSVLLGDKTIDYLFTQDKLYLLNEFGSQLDNAVLIKVNPSDLKVDDLVELKTNENTILSEDKNTETVLVGQRTKLKQLDKNVKKTPVVLPVKANSLQKELFVKGVPFDREAFEVDGFIYEVKEGAASIYSSSNGEKAIEVDVKEATKVMPLK